MTVNAAIVDDEPLARSRLKRLLSMQNVNVVAEGENGYHALQIAERDDVDIMFLDINMSQKNGLDAAREMNELVAQPPALIFCTAYDHFAVEAFKTNAIAYLLKPFETKDLEAALQKASSVSRLQVAKLVELQSDNVSIPMTIAGVLENVPASKVLYFHSVDKHVYAVLESGSENLIDVTLKEVEEKYKTQFVRVNRSVVVNRGQALRLVREAGAPQLEIKYNSTRFLISRRRLSEVKECFV